ncbi:MAG TPA: queuosine salvage family protein [Acidimicrobiales bacterium]|nr:queuosine salvage family protein [Acidimicrobiales bacterium]
MADGVLDEIRERCAEVAERATHVRIDHERLAAYVREVPVETLGLRTDDPAHHPLGDAESTAAFVVSLDAINFGSGYFPALRKRPGMSGYHTVAAGWREHAERHGAPTSFGLTELRRSDCCEIFGQDDDEGPAAELMELFASALNDLGAFLMEHYDGSFVALAEDADHSAEALVGILGRMPMFHDVAEYHGVDVPFYKRAQITSVDLDLAFGGTGPGRFDDLHRLTMFADNLVPHVLRVDGVLVYDDHLAAAIDAGQLLAPGTDAEIEIRACGVHAVELLGTALRAEGHERATSARLDTWLWTRGAGDTYKSRPRHRTRTVCY